MLGLERKFLEKKLFCSGFKTRLYLKRSSFVPTTISPGRLAIQISEMPRNKMGTQIHLCHFFNGSEAYETRLEKIEI